MVDGRRIRLAHWVAAIAGVVVFIGAFLPWATVDAGIVKASQSGIEADDGIITLVLGLGVLVTVGLSVYGRSWAGLVTIVLGIAVAVVGIVDWIDAETTDTDGLAVVSVGAGLVLTTIAGIATAIAGGWLFANRKEDAARQPAPDTPGG